MTATTATPPVLAAARDAYAAGLCAVPVMEDGSKAPIGAWKHYQHERPTVEQMRAFGFDQRQGLGIIPGAVSGNVEMLEFDDRAAFDRFIEAAAASGLGELVARIRAGYEEETPGNGIHWFYRCEEIAGNTTLARCLAADGKKKALIQTRGEGGFVVVAPSHGKVHPTGRPYRLVSGSFATIATITPDERRDLWALARSFDEVIRPEVADPTPRPTSPAQGDRPGDLFNAVVSWEDILTPHGWTLLFRRGGVGYWRRPGKDHGISATTNHGGYDYFYVFTTSTEFDDERGYSRFSVYATLEHGGDFRAAARALKAQGYGGQTYRPTVATLDGERVDVATPDADVDDVGQAVAELRARVIDMERRFRQREEEWSALGQHLGNEHISPTDRIIMYKLASEALSRPPDSGDEDGYRLIRIGMTHRKAQREGREGYGLAAAAGVDDKTVSKALKKYDQASEQNPKCWGLIGRRERFGRDEEGKPRSDILVRLPADRVADVLINWRDFAPDQPRNHGGRRTIEVPPAVARQADPVRRERKKETLWHSAITNEVIATEIVISTPDFWTAQGEELEPEEVAQLRRDSNAVGAPAPMDTYPPEFVAAKPVKPSAQESDDEPDDWDPYECNHRGCTRRPLPDKRYCDWHDPQRQARYGRRDEPVFVRDDPPGQSSGLFADAPAPVLPPDEPLSRAVPSPAELSESVTVTFVETEPIDWAGVPISTARQCGAACHVCGGAMFARPAKPLTCPHHTLGWEAWRRGVGYADAAGGG